MPPEYERVKVSPQAAMAAPREVHFNEEGVSAYSCLIPFNDEYAQRIHFVSGSDGDEYGQFRTKDSAVAHAIRLVDWLRLEKSDP